MCCFFAVLVTAGPRLASIIWWLFQPVRWSLAFSSAIWPILGIIFLPWTTLFYMLVFPGGVVGLDWLWLGIGVFADVASYTGGAARRRDLSYYPGNLP
ncbi:MAG: hypothetical protein ACC647_04455 [Anaerolineales bacterium]